MRYALIFCLTVFCFFAIAICLNAKYLKTVGELMNSQEMVLKHRSGEGACVFGTALSGNHYKFKSTSLSLVDADIVALGSSRAMQFSPVAFKVPFYNLGGAMRNLKEGHKLLHEILKKPDRPKVVLLSIDPWWFHEEKNGLDSPVIFKIKSVYRQTKRLLERPLPVMQPTKWLVSRKIPLTHYWQTVTGQNQTTIKEGCDVGVRAVIYKEGYDLWGTRHYTRRISGKEVAFDDKKFVTTISKVMRGSNTYKWVSTPSQDQIRLLASLITLFNQNSMHVVPFVAPFAPSVHKSMINIGKYAYIDAAIEAMKQDYGVHIYDLRNPEIVKANKCEFLDGDHIGTIGTLRLVKHLASVGAIPNRYIDEARLTKTITQFSGLAALPQQSIYLNDETDFLELGCLKKNFRF